MGLKEKDYVDASLEIGCEIEVIKAVSKIESRGSGFLSNNKPKILFEAHVFYKEIKKLGYIPEDYQEGNEDIIQKHWSQGRKYYKGGVKEYVRLRKALYLFPDAALKSASWGMFQIMGFNYALCNYSNVFNFVISMDLNSKMHLNAFVQFIKSKGIDKYLRNKDWNRIAYYYNGASYKQNSYHVKMEQEYKRLKNL